MPPMEKNRTTLWRTIAIGLAMLLVGLGMGWGCASVSPSLRDGGSSSLQASSGQASDAGAREAAAQGGVEGEAESSPDQSSIDQGLFGESSLGESLPESSGTNAQGFGEEGASSAPAEQAAQAGAVAEDGSYTSKDDVAAYIHEFGHLPQNFISKTKAKKAGWVAKEGNLDEVLPGMSIGGSEFYNDEGLLPDAPGRTWTECDINYTGGFRGAERIVFSNDGLVFYTDDHYKTFEQLY